MSRWLFLTAVAVAVSTLGAGRASAEPRYPHLHHALYEMREAHKELRESRHNYGGHRDKALDALDSAIHQMEKTLEAAGDPYVGYTPPRETYREYGDHPHLRHSLHEMREARTQLKDTRHNFGGHRDKAIHDLDEAIYQIEKCIEYAR